MGKMFFYSRAEAYTYILYGEKPYASGTIGVESPDPPERAVPLRRSEALPLFFLCALAGLADYLWSM